MPAKASTPRMSDTKNSMRKKSAQYVFPHGDIFVCRVNQRVIRLGNLPCKNSVIPKQVNQDTRHYFCRFDIREPLILDPPLRAMRGA